MSHTNVSGQAATRVGQKSQQHEHRLGHAVAAACEACVAAVTSLLTTSHPDSWELAVQEYDRTHGASLPVGTGSGGRAT